MYYTCFRIHKLYISFSSGVKSGELQHESAKAFRMSKRSGLHLRQ